MVEVSKVDVLYGNLLADALLQIIDSNGDVVAEWTSTEDPKVIYNLVIGETYTLHEVTAPKGYAQAEDTEFTIGEDGTITGTAAIGDDGDLQIKDMALINIHGEKVWDDTNDRDGIRPEEIIVHLFADGTEIDVITVTEDDEWKWSFGDLNKYNETAEIVYTVEEDEIEYYTTDITGDSAEGFTITNTHILFAKLTLKKTVKGDLANKNHLFSFTVEFDAEGEYEYTGSKTGTIVSGGTIQLKHGESVTIQKLPAGTTYKVTEEQTDYTVKAKGDKGTIAAGVTAVADFTNTRSSVPETGDNSNIHLWLAAMLASVIGMLTVVFVSRKRKQRQTSK